MLHISSTWRFSHQWHLLHEVHLVRSVHLSSNDLLEIPLPTWVPLDMLLVKDTHTILWQVQSWQHIQRKEGYSDTYILYWARPILAHNYIFRHISSKLYLHRNEQFLDLTGRMGYKILLGQRTESQVKKRRMRKSGDTVEDWIVSCIYDISKKDQQNITSKHKNIALRYDLFSSTLSRHADNLIT